MKSGMSPEDFASKAGEVAEILKMIGNQKRLMVLCKLVENGEMKVGDLADAVGLSQSALSQHLSRMKADGLLAFRRESQAIWYRIDDPRIEQLLGTLYELYCKE